MIEIEKFWTDKRFYLPFWVFIFGTPAVAENIDWTPLIGYTWMALGILCFIPLVYCKMTGRWNFLEAMLILAAPFLALMLFFVARPLL
jgi:hypothetical protein